MYEQELTREQRITALDYLKTSSNKNGYRFVVNLNNSYIIKYNNWKSATNYKDMYDALWAFHEQFRLDMYGVTKVPALSRHPPYPVKESEIKHLEDNMEATGYKNVHICGNRFKYEVEENGFRIVSAPATHPAEAAWWGYKKMYLKKKPTWSVPPELFKTDFGEIDDSLIKFDNSLITKYEGVRFNATYKAYEGFFVVYGKTVTTGLSKTARRAAWIRYNIMLAAPDICNAETRIAGNATGKSTELAKMILAEYKEIRPELGLEMDNFRNKRKILKPFKSIKPVEFSSDMVSPLPSLAFLKTYKNKGAPVG